MPRKPTAELTPFEVSYAEIAKLFNVQPTAVRNVLEQFAVNGVMRRSELWNLLQVGVATERGMMPKNENARRQGVQATQRAQIIERDGKRCRYCGKATTRYNLRIDHILPWALGGRNYDTNLVVACDPCNMRKRDKTVHQSRMTLLPPPNGDEQLNELQQRLALGIAKYQFG